MDFALSAVDYIVLIGILAVSAGIGVYYATFAGGQKTSNEFFLADRSMHWLPVGVSISVSVISAITFIGTSALSYYSGPGYWAALFSRILGGVITATVITPVFYNLKITSVYEYLERRFNRSIRYIAVGIHIISTFLILGVVVYAPALALNAVTGLSLVGSVVAVGSVCTFYSTIGGIKAVIWSDLFQSCIMLIGIAVVTITAIVRTGGIGEVWSRAMDGGRTALIFDFRLDPTIALSFWANVIGGVFIILPYAGTNQNQAQRYLTCSDLKSAKYSVVSGFSLTGVFEVLVVIMGFVVFSFYYGCDPLSNGDISATDQLIPYFIVEVFGSVPGLPGLLISAVFSAALSTFSTAINGITTVTGEIFVRPVWPDLPDTRFTVIMKGVSVIYGILFMLMAWVASFAGSSLIVVASRIIGDLMGPVLGVVLLGMLVPRGNSRGAIVGVTVGTAIGIWLLIGSIVFPTPPGGGLPLSTELCLSNDTSIDQTDVSATSVSPPEDTRAWIYRVSFLYHGLITTMLTFLLGVLVSLLTSKQYTGADYVDSELMSPVLISLYRKLPDTWKYKMELREKDVVEAKDENGQGDGSQNDGTVNPAFESDDKVVTLRYPVDD